MKSSIYVPYSARLAAYAIRLALPETLNDLPKESFFTAWLEPIGSRNDS